MTPNTRTRLFLLCRCIFVVLTPSLRITQQMSRYATFKVDPDGPQTIEVTPIEEWWHFKKAPRDVGKMMSVKEAEEQMKKQEHFLGPLSLANKVLGQKSMVRGCGGLEKGPLARLSASYHLWCRAEGRG